MAQLQARDFGPRLFASVVYGFASVFRAHHYFFWVPILGPIVGAILAVWIHKGLFWIIIRYGDLPDTALIHRGRDIDPKPIQTSYSNSLYEFRKEKTKETD